MFPPLPGGKQLRLTLRDGGETAQIQMPASDLCSIKSNKRKNRSFSFACWAIYVQKDRRSTVVTRRSWKDHGNNSSTCGAMFLHPIIPHVDRAWLVHRQHGHPPDLRIFRYSATTESVPLFLRSTSERGYSEPSPAPLPALACGKPGESQIRHTSSTHESGWVQPKPSLQVVHGWP